MITVMLVKPQEPGNIGAIARAMANFDIDRLIILGPLCDHLDEEAMKRGKHANGIIKKALVYPYKDFGKLKKKFDTVIGTTSLLGTDYNIPRTPLFPDEGAKIVSNDQNVAIVFGNEAQGLSNEDIRLCDFIINIPTSGKYHAINISHAAAIIFYEFYKEIGKRSVSEKIKNASRKEKDVMLEKINEIIDLVEFTTEDKKETQRIAWQRIIGKSMLSKREAFAAIGFLKKIAEEISRKNKRR